MKSLWTLGALLVWLAFSGCDATSPEPTPTPNTPSDSTTTTFSYLALGDSYTIGHAVPASERFPEQLMDSLWSDRTDKSLRVIATTGWTTDELQAGIDTATALGNDYDMVSLLIGVNNQYRSYPIDTYRVEFTALLEQAIAFADGDTSRVFVVSIPDYAYTPFGNGNATISAGIDAYNAINKDITESYGVAYFDITPISREGLSDPALVAEDGLHPSGKQYGRWVSLMLPTLRQWIE